MSYVRGIARDGVNMDDKWAASSVFLFATLKAHAIMQDFMRLSIKDYISVFSKMAKFVCYSQPSSNTSALMTRLSAIETLQHGDQSNVSKHDNHLKKLET